MVQKFTCDVHTGGNEAMSAHTPLEACPRRKRGVLLSAWSKTSVITRRRPQIDVKENGAERDGVDNNILEASTTPSFGVFRGVYSKKQLKPAQSGASPCVFFRKDKKIETFSNSGGSPGKILSLPAHPPPHTAELVKGGTTVINQQLDYTPQAEPVV